MIITTVHGKQAQKVAGSWDVLRILADADAHALRAQQADVLSAMQETSGQRLLPVEVTTPAKPVVISIGIRSQRPVVVAYMKRPDNCGLVRGGDRRRKRMRFKL